MAADDTMNPTDAELVRQIRSGRTEAFDALMQRYDRKVFSLAASYVHSADDAKDIFQEVFVRVYKGLPEFELRSEFSTWLYRIATNVCLTHRTRAKRRRHNPLSREGEEEDGVSHGVLASTDQRIDEAMEKTDISERIQEALSHLSPRQRLVFALKHFEGYKVREIAELSTLTEGAVKKYLFEATERIRKVLSPYLIEYRT